MKRSEMLKVIAEAFAAWTCHDDPNTDLQVSNHILEEIEKSGMLPPFSHKVFQKKWAANRDPVYASGNDWDEEDTNFWNDDNKSGAV